MSLDIVGISKSFKKKKALNSVSLHLDKGLYALLGANGAGKTTLINILVTAMRPTEGQVLYNGRDIFKNSAEYLGALGFLPQIPKFYGNFTAPEFLRYMGSLKGVNKTKAELLALLKKVGLPGEENKKVGAYSGGMLKRLGVAQALLNDPEIVILDEPTAGLDPKERIRFKNLISEICSDKTVLLATHIVSDVEFIAKSVILLDRGTVCRFASPAALLGELSGKVFTMEIPLNALEDAMRAFSVSSISAGSSSYTIRIVSDARPFHAVPVPPTLDDVFLYFLGDNAV